MKASQKRKEKKERKERLYRPRSAGERAAARRSALYALITLIVCAVLLIGTAVVILIGRDEPHTENTDAAAPIPTGTSPTENLSDIETRYTVIIDPGHGGPDKGNKINDELYESELAMSLAEEIADILSKEGCEVVFTHTSDLKEILSEEKRIKNVSGDCMISLHTCVKKGVYYSLLSDTTERSGYLAEYFGKPKAESEHVITRPTSVPCVLLGIDEDTDAEPIAEGIMAYLERFVK